MFEVQEESFESSMSSKIKTKKLTFPFKNHNKEQTKHTINFNESVEDPENLEQKLDLIYENLLLLYNKKQYLNVLQEIDGKEEILFKDSIMSFNIYILKIKTHIKSLKEKFNDLLNSNKAEPNYFEVETWLITINNDFNNLKNLLDTESDYEYEQLTEIYCKFLLLLSLFKLRKDSTIEAFCYINLGIKMLKTFFIRKKTSTNIKMYYVYIRLLLLLINQIISDNNCELALLYIDLLFKIIEKSMKQFIKNDTDFKYQYKFMKIIGFAYLYSGYCFELENDYISALQSYKQAYYFLKKEGKFQITLLPKDSTEVDEISKAIKKINDIIFFPKKLVDKILYKLNQDKLEKIKKYKLSEREKLILKNKKSRYGKEMMLRLIANGFSGNYDKFNIIENKIYNNILTPSNQFLIDKLDDELMTLVYKERSKNKKQNKKIISLDTKKNMFHYEIYNSLMSKKYKGYITKSENFQFSDPQQEKTSLDKIQGFLNNKLYQDSAIETNNLKKSKKNIVHRNHNLSKSSKVNIFNNFNFNTITNTEKNLTTNDNSLVEGDYFVQSFKPKTSYFPILKMNSNSCFTDRRSIDFTKKSSSLLTSNKKSMKNKNKRVSTESIGFSKSYFKKYLYLDALTCKELNFQKSFLNIKNNNSKLYFGDFKTELQNNGRVPKEDIYKKYLVLKDKANSKFVQYRMEDVIQLRNQKNEPKLIGGIFKTFSSRYENGMAAKYAVHKVINRYIDENRTENLMKPLYYVDTTKVKSKNEDYLLNLNNGIKEINYLLQIKSEEIKKTK